ncbi:hypothetical protein B0A49_07136 [Cryomyces minteri]|uniref:Mtf2-like C-terminal domain-containing protein n=1 Tax=Cryomyces minteri TaxID=331657 RepID=A0A4U0WY73_9PEZI|nr:hypothetical protein B0A49_07136 [Cryomyces minteri]
MATNVAKILSTRTIRRQHTDAPQPSLPPSPPGPAISNSPSATEADKASDPATVAETLVRLGSPKGARPRRILGSNHADDSIVRSKGTKRHPTGDRIGGGRHQKGEVILASEVESQLRGDDAEDIVLPRHLSQQPSRRPYRRSDEIDESQDFVPFEDMEIEATREERQASTITDGERASFARLFDMMVASSAEPEVPKPQEKRKEPRKAAQALDGLDDLLDNAVRKAKREPPHLTRPKGFIHRLPRSLQDMAASAAEVAQQRRNAFEEAITTERDPHDPMKLRQDEDYRKVEGLLVAAQTDLELWNVLEDNVFARIRKLDLDNENPVKSRVGADKAKKTKRGRPKKETAPAPDTSLSHLVHDSSGNETRTESLRDRAVGEATAAELAIIGPNYPSFLLRAMRILRHDFPSSLLALSLLPAVKGLGRASYILGASTQLYNELIAIMWHTWADFDAIDELLQEMDRGGLEFNHATLDLLLAIRRQKSHVSDGKYGPAMGAVWEMSRFRRGLKKMDTWRGVVRERLEADAIRKANEQLAEADEAQQDDYSQA